MYILQNGKLYVQDGEFLVGVSVTPTGNILFKEERIKRGNNCSILTPSEVRARYQINYGKSYEFPITKRVEPKVEVEKDEPTRKTKTTTRKSTSK